MKRLLIAITFLTRLPIPVSKEISQKDMARITPFFTLVGVIIGCLLILINYALSFIFPNFAVNTIIVISLFAITGGLHLDGLMDTFDGLLSGKNQVRKLEIMRDSRVGAMGVASAICIFASKLAFLNALSLSDKVNALLLFPIFGRWSMVFAISFFPYANAKPGLGSLFVEHARKSYVFWATIPVIILAIPLLLWKAFPVLIVIFLFTWLIGRSISKKLGGLTGDTYGAICEIIETLSLAILSIKINL
ncbi:MAG: adenosylcobinamide-GDP ribazoletransferase [Candidatus Omnitrophica bacterium]|nr:adenosylcobinamide-GDP ribazoletransferase [Candidatus Omnitrophota bacterium]